VSDERSDRADARLFVWLMLVGMVVFAVAVAVGGVLGSDPGSLADWVAAVSTFAALLAASYAAVQTRRTFRLEQERDAERVDQTRRAQAVQVAVWTGEMDWISTKVTHVWSPGSTEPDTTRDPGPIRPESIRVNIQNASPVPVYHLRVEVYVGEGGPSTATHAATFAVQGREHGIAVVGRMDRIEIATPELVSDLIGVLETIPGADNSPANTYFGWSFQDNAGKWWRRFPTGALVTLDGPPTSGPTPKN